MEKGKYIIDGVEVNIDYDSEISSEILKKLESCNMNQLDAYYIRRRMHFFARLFDKVNVEIENIKTDMDEKFKMVPGLIDNEIHRVVNGNFKDIKYHLEQIKSNQESVDRQLGIFNKSLIEKIDYIAGKTIFGWMKNTFEKKPVRTIIMGALLGVFVFVFLMATFHVKSFNDLAQYLSQWFK